VSFGIINLQEFGNINYLLNKSMGSGACKFHQGLIAVQTNRDVVFACLHPVKRFVTLILFIFTNLGFYSCFIYLGFPTLVNIPGKE
jgi:hypothetical protein